MLVDEVGLTSANEYVRAKTLKWKPDPKVPKDSPLRWPYTHVFGHANEVWSNLTINRDLLQMTLSGEASAEQAQQFIEMAAQDRAGAAPQPCPTEGGTTAQPPPQPREQQGVPGEKGANEANISSMTDAMKVIGRAHGEWDRRKRDAKAVVSRCQKNSRTQGSVVLQELEDMLKTGNDLDDSLVSMETSYKAGGGEKGEISDDETKKITDKVKEDSRALANLLKATSKHMQSLNAVAKLM